MDLLAASLTHNKEREAQIDFSLTTFVTGQKVLVKKTSGIADVPQLGGKRVLTVKGGTQEPNIRKAVPSVDVVTFETTQQAFLALQQGKGVAYVNDESSLIDDLGKLGVPNAILDKPGPLTEAEYEQIKRHPELTLRILSPVVELQSVAEMAACHHERLDGRGYFRGLAAPSLAMGARIVAVADVYEALIADRP